MANYFPVTLVDGRRFDVRWDEYGSKKEPKNMQYAEFLALVTNAALKNRVEEPPLRLMHKGTQLDRHNYTELASDNFGEVKTLIMVPNKEASRSAERTSIFRSSPPDVDSTAVDQDNTHAP